MPQRAVGKKRFLPRREKKRGGQMARRGQKRGKPMFPKRKREQAATVGNGKPRMSGNQQKEQTTSGTKGTEILGRENADEEDGQRGP